MTDDLERRFVDGEHFTGIYIDDPVDPVPDANLDITNYEWIYEDGKVRVKITLSDGTIIESEDIHTSLFNILHNCSGNICNNIVELLKDHLIAQTGCTREQLFGTRRENPEAWQSEMMQNSLISEERINMLRAPGRTRMMTHAILRETLMGNSVAVITPPKSAEKCVICENVMHNSFPPDFPDKYKMCCNCKNCLEYSIKGVAGKFNRRVWNKYQDKFRELFAVPGELIKKLQNKAKENAINKN